METHRECIRKEWYKYIKVTKTKAEENNIKFASLSFVSEDYSIKIIVFVAFSSVEQCCTKLNYKQFIFVFVSLVFPIKQQHNEKNVFIFWSRRR